MLFLSNNTFNDRTLVGSIFSIYSFNIHILFSVQIVTAQYYETGQDPASTKWMQIKTGRFTIIYPENYGPGGIDICKIAGGFLFKANILSLKESLKSRLSYTILPSVKWLCFMGSQNVWNYIRPRSEYNASFSGKTADSS